MHGMEFQYTLSDFWPVCAQDVKHLNVLKEHRKPISDRRDSKNAFEYAHVSQAPRAALNMSKLHDGGARNTLIRI